jgi:hypothetical protein
MKGSDGETTSRVPVRWLIVTSLLIGFAIAIAWLSIHAPRGVVLLKHFKEYLDALQNDEHKRIGSIIFDSYNEYRTDARNWSAVTFGSLFLSGGAFCLCWCNSKARILFAKRALQKRSSSHHSNDCCIVGYAI